MDILNELLNWRNVKQQQSMVAAGTPEGLKLLAESKRYGAAFDEIQSLRQQLAAAPEPELSSELETVANLFECEGELFVSNGDTDSLPVVLRSQAEMLLAKKDAAIYALRKVIFTNTDREVTMSQRFFSAHSNGFIQDNNFDFDAGLLVSGDFIDNEKQQYAEMVCKVLNAHNELQEQVQRQAEEIASANSAYESQDEKKNRMHETIQRQTALIEQCRITLHNLNIQGGLGYSNHTRIEQAIAAIEKEQNHFRDATKKEADILGDGK